MWSNLKILPTDLMDVYCQQVDAALAVLFEQLHDADISTETFSFYTSVSSVFSSKIEGENIELDSYVKHKRFDIAFLPDYTKKIDDLYDAYSWAQQSTLNRKTWNRRTAYYQNTSYPNHNRERLDNRSSM